MIGAAGDGRQVQKRLRQLLLIFLIVRVEREQLRIASDDRDFADHFEGGHQA